MYGSQKKIQKEVDAAKSKFTFTKNAKRPTDENAPKHPLSAYMQWACDKRTKVVEDNPDSGATEITKLLGNMWRDIKPTEKKKYTDNYETSKKRYDNLMNAYKHSSSFREHQEKLEAFKLHQTKKPFKKDPNAPKRPASAYILFTGAEREKVVKKNPDAKVTDIMKLLGEEWGKLSTTKKATWEKKAVKAKEDYAKELEKYQKSAKYKDYLKEKEAYELKMKSQRKALVAQKKRKLSSPAKSPVHKKLKGKVTEAKKPKKASPKPKKKSAPKKKKSAPKKKKSPAKKAKKVSKSKKKSAPKKSSSKKKSAPKKKKSSKKGKKKKA